MRRLLAVALATLLLPAVAEASPRIRSAEFGMSVPPVASPAHAASGRVLTPALRAPRRYDLVGASWRGRAAAVWVRGRRVHGRWSPWVRLQPSEEPARSGQATEPVWAGGDDFVQVRSSRPLHRLRLSFVNASMPASRVARAGRRVRRVAMPSGSGALSIIPRSAWGASRCRPRVTAGYGQVDVAIVHHTESLTGYSRSQSPSVVLGICLFHRNVRGWNDIGYNFLVDRFGQVFEGRAGGIEEPTIGAQAGGFNSVSTGVAAIGDFRFRRFSRAGMSSLARLLAWKLSLNGVPAIGRVRVPSLGGVFTPYRRGTLVTVNRISGHRNVDSTECPGNALYSQLPGLRSLVARLEGPVSRLDLTVPGTRVVYPQPVVLSGRLTPAAGVAIPPGSSVAIQDRLASGGRTLTTVPLEPDGSFSGTLALTNSDVIQATYLGGGGLPKLISTPVAVGVAPVVSLQASAPVVARGGVVTLSGSVTPPVGRVTIVEQQQRGTRYRRVKTFSLRVRRGAFARNVRLTRAGNFRFVARSVWTRRSATGVSAPVTVQVTG